MKININDTAKVTLMEPGVRILRSCWASTAEKYPDEFLTLAYPTWRSGVIEMQLWEAMKVFGPHIRLGAPMPISTELEYIGEA